MSSAGVPDVGGGGSPLLHQLRGALRDAQRLAQGLTPAPDAPAVEVPSPNDYGHRPGNPNWGPMLNVIGAQKLERELIDGGDPAEEWDRRADARRAAWLASPFAEAFEQLGLRPSTSYQTVV